MSDDRVLETSFIGCKQDESDSNQCELLIGQFSTLCAWRRFGQYTSPENQHIFCHTVY